MGKPKSIIYVVTMYRWGSFEAHSYVIGVFSLKTEAEQAAQDEQLWRAGKYEGYISEHVLNETYDRDADIERTAKELRKILKSLT